MSFFLNKRKEFSLMMRLKLISLRHSNRDYENQFDRNVENAFAMKEQLT